MSAALTVAAGASPTGGIVPRTLGEAQSLAVITAKSGLFGVKSPDEALVRILTGMELGLSPMQSLRGVHVLNGRPVLAADMMVGVVLSSGRAKRFACVETTAERATYETVRDGQPPQRLTYSIADAKAAGLAGRDTWAKHPAAMLRARASSQLARMVYPDVLNGLYTPDEADDIGAAPVVVEAYASEQPSAPAGPTLADRIVDASTLAELGELSAELKAYCAKHPAERDSLRALYGERRTQLSTPPDPEQDGR